MLTGEDAAEADRLLADHVPTCLTCRQTLAELQVLAGDLALDADPVAPPDLVRARILRGVEEVPRSTRRARRSSFVALAASVVALVAMGGLSFTMTGREPSRGPTQRAPAVVGGCPARIRSRRSEGSTRGRLPGRPAQDVPLYLVADLCPEPAAGHAYQLWLGDRGSFTPVGDMFVPENGVVLLELTVDLARYDEIWITQEPVARRR
jgi:hypothetical protein